MSNIKLSKFNIFTILLIPFVWIYELSVVAPILGKVGEAFPTASTFELQLVVVMPFIASIPFSIISGKLARKYDKKNLIVLGLLIYGIAGVTPFFCRTLHQVLIFRLITGIGVGMVLPLPNSIIAELFTGTQRERMLGATTSVANVANVIDSIAVGFILTLGWRYPFLCFLVCILIMFVAMAGLPKCPPVVQDINASSEQFSGTGVPKIVYALLAFMAVNWMFFAFNINNTALFMTSEHIGLPWMIGIAISLPGGISIISGIVFPNFYHKTRNFLVPIAVAIFAAGYIVMFFTHNFTTQCVANCLIGFGSGLLPPYILNLTSQKVELAKRDAAYGIVTAGIHVGFLSSPFVQLLISATTGIEAFRSLYGICAIGLAICTVIAFFVVARIKKELVIETVQE
ncbi:MFS transporter [Clostridium fermenticellae]|uniref:MFS transporter n=1 Tax=Clostridium fermenticellae TaxID=2068654 RepID=A0A386H3Y4_9CLOT|nr:MFS transporter [Clostridium fermenticellae]AYD40195.1 MFS transporter [Clostridium fermenticellae]